MARPSTHARQTGDAPGAAWTLNALVEVGVADAMRTLELVHPASGPQTNDPTH